MILLLIAFGVSGASFLLLFVIGVMKLASLADDDLAGVRMSAARNHHAKHSQRDEHTEGWAVGGGFINHGSVE